MAVAKQKSKKSFGIRMAYILSSEMFSNGYLAITH
jgi:hypothetical protein